LLHGKREAFVDSPNQIDSKLREKEANEFAADLLIPHNHMRRFLMMWRGSRREIIKFAHQVQVAPGIVVGQLQHLGEIGFHQFNELKQYNFDLTTD
jgi:HTH-type transcriptional regulator / antitoxin HigA